MIAPFPRHAGPLGRDVMHLYDSGGGVVRDGVKSGPRNNNPLYRPCGAAYRGLSEKTAPHLRQGRQRQRKSYRP